MARNYKLTWQDGGGRQTGRWRKKYRGKVFYFSGGRGKTDRDAYQAALEAWERTKTRIDAQAPKPHEPEYMRAIGEWETVLAWCRKHRDDEMAVVAMGKIDRLRKNLSARKPPAVTMEDRFEGRFVNHPALEAMHRDTAAIVMNAADMPTGSPSATAIHPSQLNADIDSPDPLAIERAVWEDRLAVMQRNVPEQMTVEAHVERFVAEKSASVAAGELSRGRAYTLQLYLDAFADWLGRGTPVLEIGGKILSDYRMELLKKVEAGEWSTATANHRMIAIKSWVRWLWHVEAIPALPRILDGKSGALRIGESPGKIIVFTAEEIATLLNRASDRTKLYILLMLNAGMTQKDVADLRHTEVDWSSGRITRKRSKTRKHDNVPEVGYALWPETLRLLKQETSEEGSEAVLLNENGEKIWQDKIVNAKYRKNDNVKSAFARLCKKTKIKKPLKSLKKTSATLLRGNPQYATVEHLFLGHAAGTIAHKHYSQAPQKLLDDAIEWLGYELGITAGL